MLLSCALLPDKGNLPLRSYLTTASTLLRSEARIARFHY